MALICFAWMMVESVSSTDQMNGRDTAQNEVAVRTSSLGLADRLSGATEPVVFSQAVRASSNIRDNFFTGFLR